MSHDEKPPRADKWPTADEIYAMLAGEVNVARMHPHPPTESWFYSDVLDLMPAGIVILGQGERVRWANRTWCQDYARRPLESCLARIFAERVPCRPSLVSGDAGNLLERFLPGSVSRPRGPIDQKCYSM